ncbi:hypothetical protein BST14_26725 [Mycobacterium arosiense ATCC BAA-1401 = DSM 45069]|uniref:Uncharacterized protein n=1 Tax=Mycobacterium arosiense ATCC BAA-1401 = DSM 45069 TaxID=1265311 RepID=A0A1W9Z5T4_MYCAI|nr:hypothetical protein BST14_26725 [Mycobacterium arosiense ATCC BAA-1401 = DSM 45069]
MSAEAKSETHRRDADHPDSAADCRRPRSDLWRSFFANIAQIFLMPQWYFGLLFLTRCTARSLTNPQRE